MLRLSKVYAAMQEQVKAARQGAAGTLDEYTFVGEDGRQEGPSGAAVQQSLSAEQQYKTEMLQELQVNILPHVAGERCSVSLKLSCKNV